MNENEITIQGSIATWVMPRMESEYGGTYTGTFKFRCYLNPLQTLEAGREYRSLLGNMGHAATNLENNLAFALSQLKQRVISAPPFWTSTKESGIEGNIGDVAIILAVINAAERAELMFKENIQKERDALLDNAIKLGEEIQQKGDI